MGHRAIIGMTESGKTYAARHIARQWKAANWETLVLHKKKEPWNKDEVTIQTIDIDLFLEKIEERNEKNEHRFHNLGIPADQLRGYVAFIEIADANVNKFDERVHNLFSQERHNAHKFHYLSQRAQAAHPDIRENCQSLMLLMCHDEQAKSWSKEFNDPRLRKATNIPPHWMFFKPARNKPAIYTKL